VCCWRPDARLADYQAAQLSKHEALTLFHSPPPSLLLQLPSLFCPVMNPCCGVSGSSSAVNQNTAHCSPSCHANTVTAAGVLQQ
jgi:hypothetical protein